MAGKTPLVIFKEAIYSKLLDLPEKEGQLTNLQLDSDVAPLKLRELFNKYSSRFGMPAGISSAEDLKKIRMEMAAGMRHKGCDLKLCYSVAFQTLEKGLPYVMMEASREAQVLKQYSKEVTIEINQNKTLEFKYDPNSPNVIFAYTNLQHNTADIILKYYLNCYPDKAILIYTRRDAFWVRDGNYGQSDLESFAMDMVYGKQLASL